MKPRVLVPFNEELAHKIAGIAGESSATARALKELKRRRKQGEVVYLWWAAHDIVVGPDPVTDLNENETQATKTLL